MRRTCLIVDDSRMIRRVAGRIIRELDFDAEEAGNGQEAIDMCRTKMPEAILLDRAMPVMDGISFLKTLRGEPGGQSPIVVFCSCLLYTSPSPRDQRGSRMPSSA